MACLCVSGNDTVEKNLMIWQKKIYITGTKPLNRANEQIAFKEEQGCTVIPYERRQSVCAGSWEIAGWQHEVFF